MGCRPAHFTGLDFLIDLATVAMIAAGSWVNDNARRVFGLG
jgi:hypothetical protein